MLHLTAESISALATLTILEIVLGIDNIVFLSILVSKLPEAQQGSARTIGLLLAMVARIGLLFTISWIVLLTEPFLFGFSGRDLILLGGGLFLVWKATHEIHEKIEGAGGAAVVRNTKAKYGAVLMQIMIIDIVFSLDSVITAVGIVNDLPIMVTAIVISIAVMLAFSGAISRFIDKHPTFKILALSFLIMVGVLLVSEAFGKHIERGYVYFAMAFSFLVELVNTKIRSSASK